MSDRIPVVRWYVLSGLAIAAVLFSGAALLAFEDLGSAHGIDVSIALPRPSGPYAVGRRLFDWTDANRAEPFNRKRRRE